MGVLYHFDSQVLGTHTLTNRDADGRRIRPEDHTVQRALGFTGFRCHRGIPAPVELLLEVHEEKLGWLG
jgi:hypothetical protein